MKTKNELVGQFLSEGLGEAEDDYDYTFELMPLIGEIVIWFNSLEADIDQVLCGFISDRTDQKGLLIVSSMMYSTKLDLFERFATEHFRENHKRPEWLPKLISDLKECGTLRNKVIHANWMNTDNEGYTRVRIRFSRRGLEHELVQFTKESLNLIISKIDETRSQLDYFCIEHLP